MIIFIEKTKSWLMMIMLLNVLKGNKDDITLKAIEACLLTFIVNFWHATIKPAGIYLLKVNNRNTRVRCKNMFKVNNKDTITSCWSL